MYIHRTVKLLEMTRHTNQDIVYIDLDIAGYGQNIEFCRLFNLDYIPLCGWVHSKVKKSGKMLDVDLAIARILSEKCP